MQFTILREALIKPLQRVVGAVERKQAQPILANVLVSVKNQLLSLTGTDLEMEMITRVSLQVPSEPGATTIPGKKWLDICKALPEQAMITVSVAENKVFVQSGKSRFILTCLFADNFPRIEESVGDVEFSVPHGTLKKLLDFTSFAMAHQDVRYYLNGVYMIFSSQELRVVATDGHRLATISLPIRSHLSQPISVILPRKAVQELQRVLAEEEDDDEIAMVIGKNHLRAVTTQTSFITKLVDGRFPDYRRVLPKTGEGNILEISREQLKQALLRVSALFSDRFRGVHLQFFSKMLRIVASTPEGDQVQDEIEGHYQGPEEMKIGLNASYLLEYLNIITAPQVRVTFTHPDHVILFEATEGSGTVQEQQAYVIMPMRL